MGEGEEDIEARWLRDVYQRGAPQLTLRALAMGAAIGGLLSLSNLYLQLKLGVIIGVAVSACLIAHGLSRALARVTRGRLTPLGIIETNAAQSVASSAAYATGPTMASAVAAYLAVTGRPIAPGPLLRSPPPP